LRHAFLAKGLWVGFGLFLLLIIAAYQLIPRTITITQIPYQIKRPGNYKLAQDFFTRAGCAIEIKANNVSLDLDGHALVGEGSWQDIQSGICAQDVRHIKIHNGHLSGFTYGILINDSTRSGMPQKSQEIEIRDLLLTNNTFRGIKIAGTRARIQNNVIRRTGGFRKFQNGFSFGIETYGERFEVLNNEIEDTFPVSTGEGVAICLADHCNHCRINGNRLRNSELPVFGRTFAIWVGGNTNHTEIKNNVFTNFTHGFNGHFDNIHDLIKSGDVWTGNVFEDISCLPDEKEHYPARITVKELIRDNIFKGQKRACADTEKYYLSRFSQDLPEVQYRLGQIHMNNWAKATFWFKKAADQGHFEARRVLEILEKNPY
jgi:hypothetical protein